jgi:hypothetical protein
VSFRIILLACAAAAILAAETDRCVIRGEVTDSLSASIGNAIISVYPKDSPTLAFRGNAHRDGTFCIKDLSPGPYTVKAWQSGFHAKRVRDVGVRQGATVDVGSLKLEVIGCDPHQVLCCLQVATPEVAATLPVVITQTDLSLPKACGANLSTGTVLCHQLANDADIIFVEEHGALLLQPVNGTQMDPACQSVYRDQPLRLETLGTGDDLCVKTQEGYASHVFFEGDDIAPDTKELKIWIVTTK